MTKKYDKEFKLQTVPIDSGRRKNGGASRPGNGLHENTLYRWIAEFKQDGDQAFPAVGNLSPTTKRCAIFRNGFVIWKRRTRS